VWSASEHGYLDQARCHRPFINALSCRNPCPVAGRSAVRLCRCQGVCQTLIEDIADVLLGHELTVAAHPEHDCVDASTGVEPPVAGTVLLQELGSVALAMGGSLEQADLRAVVVGVVRRLQLVDHGHDAGLAEGTQKQGDLLDRPATQVARPRWGSGCRATLPRAPRSG